MAFDTRLQLKTWLTGQMPTGVGGVNATTILNEAIADAVGYAGMWIRDTQRLDFVGDGVTSRFLLPGVDCELADAPYQETPTGLATAILLATPVAAPAATILTSGGSIGPGVYYYAVAYSATVNNNAAARTAPSAYVTVIVPSGAVNRITLTWTAPNTALDPSAGSQIYGSPASGVADIRDHGISGAVSGSAATVTLTALTGASGARPLADYKELFTTYVPLKNLEQDIGLDGLASVGNATLTLTTTPTLGDHFRVVYDRKPAIPTADGDTIYVEQGQMRLIALMFAAKACSYVAEAGDSTLLSDMAARTDLLVSDMQRKAAPKLKVRPRMPDPRS